MRATGARKGEIRMARDGDWKSLTSGSRLAKVNAFWTTIHVTCPELLESLTLGPVWLCLTLTLRPNLALDGAWNTTNLLLFRSRFPALNSMDLVLFLSDPLELSLLQLLLRLRVPKSIESRFADPQLASLLLRLLFAIWLDSLPDTLNRLI